MLTLRFSPPLTCRVPKAPKFEKVEIRDHCKRNIKSFVQFLSEGSNYTPLLECDCVESVTVGLSEHIAEAYQDHFPSITVKRHEKFIHKPSKEFLDAVENTKKAHSKFKNLLRSVMKEVATNVVSVVSVPNLMRLMKGIGKSLRNHRTKVSRSCRQANLVDDLKAKSMKNDLKGIWKF